MSEVCSGEQTIAQLRTGLKRHFYQVVLAGVHGLTCLFRAVSAVEPSLCGPPLPTLSPSLIGHLASVDVKQHERKKKTVTTTENDSCSRMSSDESHFNVSVGLSDGPKVTRQCPQTTTSVLKRTESRSGIEPRSFRLPT